MSFTTRKMAAESAARTSFRLAQLFAETDLDLRDWRSVMAKDLSAKKYPCQLLLVFRGVRWTRKNIRIMGLDEFRGGLGNINVSDSSSKENFEIRSSTGREEYLKIREFETRANWKSIEEEAERGTINRLKDPNSKIQFRFRSDLRKLRTLWERVILGLESRKRIVRNRSTARLVDDRIDESTRSDKRVESNSSVSRRTRASAGVGSGIFEIVENPRSALNVLYLGQL